MENGETLYCLTFLIRDLPAYGRTVSLEMASQKCTFNMPYNTVLCTCFCSFEQYASTRLHSDTGKH